MIQPLTAIANENAAALHNQTGVLADVETSAVFIHGWFRHGPFLLYRILSVGALDQHSRCEPSASFPSMAWPGS
jgi:hypothetical protein